MHKCLRTTAQKGNADDQTRRQGHGLIAIESSCINFILVGGLITAIPLFITYCLFLFRSFAYDDGVMRSQVGVTADFRADDTHNAP
jgi:hypothetical protein